MNEPGIKLSVEHSEEYLKSLTKEQLIALVLEIVKELNKIGMQMGLDVKNE
jgi:hypothetical protein